MQQKQESLNKGASPLYCSSGYDDDHVALRKANQYKLFSTRLGMAMHSLFTSSAAMPAQPVRTWTCEELLRGHATKKYALIIVNQPIRRDLLDRAWQAVDIRLCADGGANRLFDVDHEKRYVCCSTTKTSIYIHADTHFKQDIFPTLSKATSTPSVPTFKPTTPLSMYRSNKTRMCTLPIS